MPNPEHELHEGNWLYVSAHIQPADNDRDMLDSVLAVCRGNGWPVIVGDHEMSPERRAQALRLADACIVNVTVSSAEVEVEISLALGECRPTIALRRSAQPAATSIAHGHDAFHELRFRDRDECVQALEQLLMDPDWQRRVAVASPTEDHV